MEVNRQLIATIPLEKVSCGLEIEIKDDNVLFFIKDQKAPVVIKEKAAKIKVLLTDSDGVLTDGGMFYSEKGDELKKFNTKDGMGLHLVRETGIITGIITGEDRQLVKNRALKLSVNELHMGISDKMEILNQIKDKYGVSDEEICYIGDDINDLAVIKKVGLGCAVNDAMEIIKNNADYITSKKGGQGAVREIAEIILQARGDLGEE